MKGKSEERKKQ